MTRLDSLFRREATVPWEGGVLRLKTSSRHVGDNLGQCGELPGHWRDESVCRLEFSETEKVPANDE